MSKSIIVLDTPKNCNKCPICASYAASSSSIREYWCVAVENKDVYPDSKPAWCPLKPIPKKREEKYASEVGDRDSGFIDGWNACIDEILYKHED